MAGLTRVVPYPLYYDPAHGDLVIRTSDSVEFHVEQRRIADLSPVFAAMSSLPQPSSDSSTTIEKPFVDVSETSRVWEKLLPICHLAQDPPLTLEDIKHLLEAVRKYCMPPGIASKLRAALFEPALFEEKPFAVYALACAGGFADLARLAAKRTLRLSIYPEPATEYSSIGADALYRLFDYRKQCGILARSVVIGPSDSTLPAWMYSDVASRLAACDRRCALPTVTIVGARNVLVPECWMLYLKTLGDALQLRPDSRLPCDPAMLQPVSDSLLGCTTCQSRFYGNAVAASEMIAGEIERTIAMVECAVVA
ncbi:hypothetical protein C8Q76DRAFT_658528 [Earliella scabrosa]|nr:hypothetical protein C8Q76DRAFT_658528 [Earliella scabrosa]